MLADLTAQARRRGLNDTRWCQAAGVRKETLSRLRKRGNCDLATLTALARAAGAQLAVTAEPVARHGTEGHFPDEVGRDREERLLELVASGSCDPRAWRLEGPPFFMAGLAVTAASSARLDRRRLLAVAEALHPGSSLPEVFAYWLARSPVRPSRFVPMLKQRMRHAA
jgi:hypothetical protein